MAKTEAGQREFVLVRNIHDGHTWVENKEAARWADSGRFEVFRVARQPAVDVPEAYASPPAPCETCGDSRALEKTIGGDVEGVGARRPVQDVELACPTCGGQT